jgi:hypothetical protein
VLTLLILLPLLNGLVQLPTGPARAEEAGSGSHAARITITDVGPAVPSEDDILTLRGTVTNTGGSAIVGASLAPREGVRLMSRSAIGESAGRVDFSPETDGAIVRGRRSSLGTIKPGLSRPFTLRVPVSELALGDDGVYQVAVSLTGQTEKQQWDQVLGVGRTVLPWQPTGQSVGKARTQLTFLWPLISSTHFTARTEPDEEQTPVLRDHSLLAETWLTTASTISRKSPAMALMSSQVPTSGSTAR